MTTHAQHGHKAHEHKADEPKHDEPKSKAKAPTAKLGDHVFFHPKDGVTQPAVVVEVGEESIGVMAFGKNGSNYYESVPMSAKPDSYPCCTAKE